MSKLLDRIFGERLPVQPDPEGEERELEQALVNHKSTLGLVDAVLSDSQRRVALAIDDTAELIEKERRRRRHR